MFKPTSVFEEKSYFNANGGYIGSISVNNARVGDEQIKSVQQSGEKLPPDFNEYSCTVLTGFVISV